MPLPFGCERRIGRAFSWLGWLLACTVSQAAQAQDVDPANLLLRMSAAVRVLDYQGSFIYEHNGVIDAMRLFHEGSGGRERERLIGMSGARSEMLRDGDTVICQAPAPARLLSKDAPARLLPLVPNTQGPKFAKLYSVVGRGNDRVAGYSAQVVEIRPQDPYRYGYRLWLDDSTHLLLRSAVVDAGGRVLEQFMFVALDIGAKPNESDIAPAARSEAEVPDDETRISGSPRWYVADLPAGFSLRSAQRPAQAPTLAEHHVYSDGIATVSAYVEPRDPVVAVPPDSASTFGAISICGHAERDWKFTVVGDVPPATVQRMARSLQPMPASRGSVPAS